MISHSTKEAIKTGLALSLTMMTAHWLGWQKTSWAMLTVIVLSVTQFYGYSALKAQNRILATILGAAVGFSMLCLFPQNRALFLSSMVAYILFTIHMGFDKRRGYVYSLSGCVALIVASAGISDGATGFSTGILRLQDNLLGLTIFTLVFRLLWPNTTESEFERIANETIKELEADFDALSEKEQAEKLNKLNANIAYLTDLVTLPESKKTKMAQYKGILTSSVNGLQYLVESKTSQNSSVNTTAIRFSALLSEIKLVINTPKEAKLDRLNQIPTVLKPTPKNGTVRDHLRPLCVALGMSISVIALWIYLPVPGGALFPIIGLVLATNVCMAPAKFATPILFIYMLFTASILLQYVFIFPSLTESWQLAIIFFLNIVIWHSVLDILHLGAVKVLMGNALVNIPGGATELVPTYSITGAITMIVNLFIVLALFRFFALAFENIGAKTSS
jgi:uncharacterized membrane protein YgaE (UPF0421/DUF939 family)